MIQKSCRGYAARATVAKMKAARATMYRIFLSIQNRRKWAKLIKERKKIMGDAAKKISRFYRWRYRHFKTLFEVDERIRIKKMAAEQRRIEEHRRKVALQAKKAKAAVAARMKDLYKKKQAEIKKWHEENRERIMKEK